MSHPADESISEEDDSKDDGTNGEESNDSDEEVRSFKAFLRSRFKKVTSLCYFLCYSHYPKMQMKMIPKIMIR